MACQSLDNDEILNVRWATEDPNPVQKVAEKRRLEVMGQEAIQSKMDHRIVDAMRAVRALEDGVEMDDGDVEVEAEELQDDAEPEAKRRRIEHGPANSASPSPPPQEEAPPNPTALLSADTLEGLKYFAQIRQRHAGNAPQQQRAPAPAKTTGLMLADYGSDDDE